jgi:hypothetical protein
LAGGTEKGKHVPKIPAIHLTRPSAHEKLTRDSCDLDRYNASFIWQNYLFSKQTKSEKYEALTAKH